MVRCMPTMRHETATHTPARGHRLGTQLGAKDAAREDALADAAAREKLGAAAGVGRYLGAAPAARGVGAAAAGAKRSADASMPAEAAPSADKRKKQRGFGDFSAW